MTGAVVALALALLTLAAAMAAAVVAVVRTSGRHADAAGEAANARADATIARADVDAAVLKIAELDKARARQQTRADALEADLIDLEANPILMADPGERAGRARLRAALRAAAEAGAGDPAGDHPGGGVPEPSAAVDPGLSPRSAR